MNTTKINQVLNDTSYERLGGRKDELKKIVLNINADMIGCVIKEKLDVYKFRKREESKA